MKDYGEYKVWHKAHALVLEVYRVTADFPREEKYELISQVRRSAVSVAANIAEGCCRYGDAEFCRFLKISAGSISETKYFFLMARDLKFLPADRFDALTLSAAEIQQMLDSLIRKVDPKRKWMRLGVLSVAFVSFRWLLFASSGY